MKTLHDLLNQTGSYFRSLCRITEFNNDGSNCSLLTLPADCQIGFYTLNGNFGMSPLITSNGGDEGAKFWLTFEEATTILKAYAQAWERSNPQGVWEEEGQRHSIGNPLMFSYGGYGVVVEATTYCIYCEDTAVYLTATQGDEHEARTALFDHLQSLKGGGK